MKFRATRCFIFAAALGLLACGEEPVETPPQVECGEGTIQYGDQCVPDTTCGETEIRLNDGRCVRGDYCAEGTAVNPETGRCIAVADTRCGTGTELGDNDECIPRNVYTCGEGTVASDGRCLPHGDVCGPGTDMSQNNNCRPSDEICGEGTIYDQTRYQCVPISTIVCGPGTTAVNAECIPSRIFYEALAATPDLDMTESGATGEITLKDVGERFVFIGNIDAPTISGTQATQHIDRYTFTGEAGQWVRIGIYSLGLPEPGFFLTAEDDRFLRQSDMGDGLEISRDVLVPFDETMTLEISNLPQMLGTLNPAGGDDWGYVGFIEVVDAPQTRALDITSGSFQGAVNAPRNNFYHVTGAEEGLTYLTVFDTLPLTAQGEVQVWSDASTLESIHRLDDAVAFEAPGESFYVLFDRDHLTGRVHVNYQSSSIMGGGAAAAGEVTSFEIALDANEYIGVTQTNLDGKPLLTRIVDNGEVASMAPRLLASGPVNTLDKLYHYVDAARTVTIEFENTSDQDLDFFSFSFETGSPLHAISVNDDFTHTFTQDDGLAPGESDLIVFQSATGLDFDLTVTGADGDVLTVDIKKFETRFTHSVSDDGEVSYSSPRFQRGGYFFEISSLTGTSGYELELNGEVVDFITFRQDLDPPLTPASDGNINTGIASTSMDVTDCPEIESVSIRLNFTGGTKDWSRWTVVSPEGTRIRINDQDTAGGTSMAGNSPWVFPDNVTPTESMDPLIGQNANGSWSIELSSRSQSVAQPMNWWEVELICND